MKSQHKILLVVSLLLLVASGCRLRSDEPQQQSGRIVAPSEIGSTTGYEELRRQLELTRDSLVIANSMLETLEGSMYASNDSLLRRYALDLWLDGRSTDAISMLSIVDGRTQESRFGDRRGSLLLTFSMLSAVVLGFLYVCLRIFRSMSDVQSERPFNKGIAALAGLLIYYVFSVAGISLPVLILNSLAVKPIYSIILNFLSLMLGATATLFVGKMLASDGERTVLAGIILGIFTTVFFIDMLFKALFYAFETTVLLPNTMFVLGVVLVYLFAREPAQNKSSYQYSERFNP